jgi:hypothetical protein
MLARPFNADVSTTELASTGDKAARPSVFDAVPLLRISTFDNINFVSKFLSLPVQKNVYSSVFD